MHALKLLGQQLSKIWHQLGINQKVVIVGSSLVVLVGLGVLVFWTSRTEYGLLFGHLDPAEAGRIVALLEESKVPHQMGAGGGSIKIPQDKVHEWRALLAAKGMPKTDGVGFEIFDKPSFGMSDFIQHQNYMRALSGELERTIAKFEGIDSAKVMIVKPESRLLVDPAKKTTASVFVTLRGMQQLEARTVNSIRNFVANSVEGLKPNNVSVVDNSGNSLSENSEDGSLGNLSSSQLGAVRSYEKYYSDLVRGMLERVVGPNQASVTIHVELNTESVTKTDVVFDPKTVARTSTVRDESTETGSPKPGGIPGTDTNSNTDTNNVAPASMNNKTTKVDKTLEFAVGSTISNVVQVAGGLKKLTASVLINTNDNPSLTFTNNLANLKTAVLNALGLPPDVEESVSLFGVSFNEKKELQVKMAVESEHKREGYMQMGKSLLYVLLGLAALVGFWRLVKTSTEELLPTGIPVGQLVGGQLVYESAMAQQGMGGMRGMSMPSGGAHAMAEQRMEDVMPQDEDVDELQAAKSKLVMDFGLGQQAPERITIEVLKQLIRENPTKMSAAARTWMSRKKSESGEPL